MGANRLWYLGTDVIMQTIVDCDIVHVYSGTTL